MAMSSAAQLLHNLIPGAFVSGKVLAAQLAVSPTTVQKIVRVLIDRGVQIDRVRGRGYRLRHGLDLLNKTEILHQLGTFADTHKIIFDCLSEVDSTNDYIKRYIPLQQNEIAVCTAEYQTAGRGRRGRAWVSPYASNVYLSLLWRMSRPISEASALSAWICVRIAQLLERCGVPGVRLKWPNDIYIGSKKVAGILLEGSGTIDEGFDLIIGVGVNVSMSRQRSPNIDQAWTDLVSETSDWRYTRSEWVTMLLQVLVQTLNDFEQCALRQLSQAWDSLDLVSGKRVQLLLANETIRGKAMGVTEAGALRLERNGQIDQYTAGDLSLRVES